ncbi:MAG: DNA polymerase IV, partial [Candidatus Sericytochromatia bacterium]
ATDDDQAIAEAARALLAQHAEPGRPVRLLGVTASGLTTLAQLSWLGAEKREERQRLNQALDKLRDRHGLWVVSRATHLKR